jgi:hypothetical protein
VGIVIESAPYGRANSVSEAPAVAQEKRSTIPLSSYRQRPYIVTLRHSVSLAFSVWNSPVSMIYPAHHSAVSISSSHSRLQGKIHVTAACPHTHLESSSLATPSCDGCHPKAVCQKMPFRTDDTDQCSWFSIETETEMR